MRLDPAVEAEGVRLLALDEVGSTNALALERVRAGEAGPLWITARRQTAGRGRRGRAWVSEPGNLFASLLLTDPAPAEHAPELSFVAALALHDAVTMLAPALQPTLKWPNDLLIDGAKFSGILIEGEGAGASFAAVVGIGVNCTHHPSGNPYPTTDLAAAGVRVTAEQVFASLSAAMQRRLMQWNRGQGFAAIRADWLAHAHGLGTDIDVRFATRTTRGRFETLDAAGRLVLVLPEGRRETIAAGEIFASTGLNVAAVR